jgi:hypothetical protein
MAKEKWREAYIQRLVDRGVMHQEAVECYEAGDDYDYASDPEDAADEELSYWSDDEGEPT